jgi:hypothetical protein
MSFIMNSYNLWCVGEPNYINKQGLHLCVFCILIYHFIKQMMVLRWPGRRGMAKTCKKPWLTANVRKVLYSDKVSSDHHHLPRKQQWLLSSGHSLPLTHQLPNKKSITYTKNTSCSKLNQGKTIPQKCILSFCYIFPKEMGILSQHMHDDIPWQPV